MEITPQDPRAPVAQWIETAVADLSAALAELDRLPIFDQATVGWVAHALNNCLSVNDALLDLIESSPAGPEQEVGKWLAGLRHLGTLMHHTVGRLLGASAQTEFPLKPDYVNLHRLMQRACDYYRPSATLKQLEIVCRSVGSVPPAWADPVAVAVVADNLLSNAVKFSNAGGQILVQILPGPGGIVCSVRDNGPGLTPLEQVQLFQRGVRVGPLPTAGEPSTGFGLAIAKDFIDRMDGRLWSESEPGRGACFSFRLPYPAGGPGGES